MKPVKVLLVDDSLFMRNSLKKILNTPEIQVVGTALNGEEAIEKNLSLNPDLILLDIEMPVMNGLVALKHIMETNPVPVVMFSSLTQEGASETIEALSLGAVDFVPKQTSVDFNINAYRNELIEKIVHFGSNAFLRSNLRARYKKTTPPPTKRATVQIEPRKSESKPLIQGTTKYATPVEPKYKTDRKRPRPSDIKIIGIGISTGGPGSLQEVIPLIDPNIPVPIVIVQHMPPLFTATLAKRLDQISTINVKETEDGEYLKPGTVYIAKAGSQVVVTRKHTIAHTNEPPNQLFNPSVNVLIRSMNKVYNGDVVGIIMTGMGNDGCAALKELDQSGGYVISQDIESCVVAGMPKAVIDAKIAHEIHPLRDIAGTINALFRR